jgi:hypothetical protein
MGAEADARLLYGPAEVPVEVRLYSIMKDRLALVLCYTGPAAILGQP